MNLVQKNETVTVLISGFMNVCLIHMGTSAILVKARGTEWVMSQLYGKFEVITSRCWESSRTSNVMILKRIFTRML